ncbi:GNAT family N-acetyltransferase [Azohydromonas caseinilytica]|nr:GNAT family N-acetyltransferase [Azohydromonas caseinilytica]
MTHSFNDNDDHIYDIRNATAAEHAAVNALALEAWQILKPGYAPRAWDGMLAAIAKMSGLAEKGELIVAAGPERIFGAVAYMPPGASNPVIFPEGWPSVRMLVTRPACRHRGIGRRLTEECIARARRDGAECIGLHTSPAMTVALPLYLRMGFTKDQDLDAIAGAPYARYVMRL